MKKVKYLLYAFIVFLIGFGVTFAKTYTLDSTDGTPCDNCLHMMDYVVGTHVFTNAYIQQNDFTTQMLMYGASSLDGSSLDNIKLYMYFGGTSMYDVISVQLVQVAPDTTYEITHVDGVCVDPSCLGQTVDVTLKYNDGVTPDLNKTLSFKSTINEPVTPTKLGHRFSCWVYENTEDCYDFSTLIEEDLVLEASWKMIEYKVRYHDTLSDDVHTESCSFGAVDRCKFLDYMWNLPEGYTFNGWSLAETGEKVYSELSNFDALFGEDEEFDLYSIFNSSSYSILYDLDGGTFTGPVDPTTVYDPAIVEYDIKDPSKVGYTFDKWEVVSGDATVSDGKLKINAGSNISLKATWNPITYNVKYGNIVLNETACVYDDICDLNLDLIKEEGKYIKDIKVVYDNSYYSIGSKVKNLTTTSGDLSVEVEYDDVVYSIIYDYNDGYISNGSNPSEILFNGESVSVIDPTKIGYNFDGWEIEPSGAAEIDNGNISLKTASDVKLIAKWSPFTYNVRYQGIMLNDDDCLYNEPCNLNFSKIEKPVGKELEKVREIGGRSREISKIVYNLSSFDGAIVDVEAIFTPINYNVTYKLNGGIIDNAFDSIINVEKNILLANNPTKVGYTFNGWDVDSDSIGKVTINNTSNGIEMAINTDALGDIVLNATWSENNYTVSFDPDGGNMGTASYPSSCSYTKCAIPNSVPKKDGYIFEGWSYNGMLYTVNANNPKGTTNVYIDSKTNVAFVAKWKNETSFKITYDLNGGKFNADPISTYIAGDTDALPIPVRDGYTFNGWFIGTTKITSVTGKSSDLAVKAEWLKNTYTIKFYNSNNKSILKTITCSYDENCSFGDNKEEFSDRVLIGWSKSANGSLFYADNLTFKNLLTSGTLNLYPVFENQFNVTYYLDGGAFVDSNNVKYSYTYGEEIVLPEVEKRGYVFKGWKNSDGNNVSSNIKVKNDLVLIPIWEGAPITVNMYSGSANGIVELVNEHSCIIDQVCVFPGGDMNPDLFGNRPGAEFVGWTISTLDPAAGFMFNRVDETFYASLANFGDNYDFVLNMSANYEGKTFNISYKDANGETFDFVSENLNLPLTFNYRDYFIVLPGLGAYSESNSIACWDAYGVSCATTRYGNDLIIVARPENIVLTMNESGPSTDTNTNIGLYNSDNTLIGYFEIEAQDKLTNPDIYVNGKIPKLGGKLITEYSWYLNEFALDSSTFIAYDRFNLYLSPFEGKNFTEADLVLDY